MTTATAKGMAIARVKGEIAGTTGAKLSDCPYRSAAWRSCWLAAYERSKQLQLPNAADK